MIRIAAVAVISASIAGLPRTPSFAGETPVLLAQGAESSDPHQHPPTEPEATHQHGGAADGPVHVQLQTNPTSLQVGARSELVFALHDPSGQPVDELLTHHGRKLHLVIVSEDMRVLGHVHPQDFGETVEGGSAKAFFTFPQAGRYLLGVDFVTARGSQDEQFIVEVEGPPGPGPDAEVPAGMVAVTLEEDERYTEPALLQAVDQSQDYAISLQRPDAIRAGEPASFAYRFTRNGEPLTDLRTYLEAPMHLAVVKDDLTVFLHTHGTLPGSRHAAHRGHGSTGAGHGEVHRGSNTFGPEIAATVTFPKTGTYYLFAQAVHGGQLLISRFPVHVE